MDAPSSIHVCVQFSVYRGCSVSITASVLWELASSKQEKDHSQRDYSFLGDPDCQFGIFCVRCSNKDH